MRRLLGLTAALAVTVLIAAAPAHATFPGKNGKIAFWAGPMQSPPTIFVVNPDGTVSHINTCESFFSLIKRGVYGAFHHVSKEHLHRYCDEFAFRWNGRELMDAERRDEAVRGAEGKRLYYRTPVNPPVACVAVVDLKSRRIHSILPSPTVRLLRWVIRNSLFTNKSYSTRRPDW